MEKIGGGTLQVLIKDGEMGHTSIGLGRGGKVGDGDLGVLWGETSLDTGDGVDDPEGGGGGGGGGDVPLLSARNEDRNFLSSLGGNTGSATGGTDGLPPDRECRFFKGNGSRSCEFATIDDMVLCRDFIEIGGFDCCGKRLLSDDDRFGSSV